MGCLSIRNKIFFLFFVLVIVSGLIIAVVEANRLDKISYEAIVKQGEHLSRAVTLEAAKKIPANDLISLRNLLNHQLKCNPNIAYLLIIKDRQILARAFSEEIPKDIINVNTAGSKGYKSFRKIAADNGHYYLDFSTPLLSGQTSVLRVGLSERLYKSIKEKLWLQLSGYILLILLLAITVSFFFIRRITRPISDLAEIAGRIDEENLEIQVPSTGDDEVAKLSASFNYMLNRMREHTNLIEQHAMELDRARHMTINSFEIIRKIWEQDNLKGVGSYLLSKFQDIVACKELVLFVLSKKNESFFMFMDDQIKILKRNAFNSVFSVITQHHDKAFLKKKLFESSLGPETFPSVKHVWTIPIYQENHLLGALLIPCPDNCGYHKQDLELIQLILKHTSRAIQRAISNEEEMLNIQRSIDLIPEYCGIVGRDPKMKAVYKLIDDIAPTDTTILIQGESGTGKELVANAIHRKSHRHDKPFVVINCSAYPATLLESELFGHEKGAFTGALRQKIGRFEQAHGGTVFLDEIGEIPLPAQIKLLRILQTKKFERVGGEKTICLDARILAASNKDLLQEVKKGNFREDLYYRLNVIPIELPPLRRRQNDIPLQTRYFLRRFAAEQGKSIVKFSPQAMRLLMGHSWPGNVRELENCVEHAVVLAQGKWIEVSDLPNEFRQAAASPANKKDHNMLRENEIRLLKEALDDCNWNKKMAAQQLGISRNTLYRRIKKYRINPPSIH